MGREWETYKLSTIIDLIGGGTPKRSNPDYWNGDIPWLSVKDFNNSYRHVSNAEKSITKGGLDNSSTKLLEPGQIIISARGTVGALAQLSKPMAFNQSCYGITGKPGYAINDFVYYLLRYAVSNLKRMTHGAVFDTITRETFDYLAVSIPSIPEQRKIAHILGTLDDKIELNRRMNATLEEMAQALFKSWFVDFDPVIDNALRAENPIPNELTDRAATRKEMLDSGKATHNPEIHPLFPDSFRDSELGPIPAGWEVKDLEEDVSFASGRSYKSKELIECRTALVTLKSFKRGGGYRSDGLKPYTGRYKNNQIVQPGEIVLACTDVTQKAEVIGQPAIVPDDDRYDTLIASLDCVIVRPDTEYMTRSFLYFLLLTEKFKSFTYSQSTGTTVLHLNKKSLPTFLYPRPKKLILHMFSGIADNFLIYKNINNREIQNSKTVRDTLLPQLISGEISV